MCAVKDGSDCEINPHTCLCGNTLTKSSNPNTDLICSICGREWEIIDDKLYCTI